MRIRLILRLAIAASLCGLVVSGNAAESTTDLKPEFRKVLSGSLETPDSLAFNDYIGYVHNRGSREKAEDFVIYTLQLSDTAEGRAIARSAVEIFEEAYFAIEQDILNSEAANICNGPGTSKSTAQIFIAMDQQDDSNEAIIEQHFQAAISKFSNSVRELVLAELARHKMSFSYATFDHKVAWEKQNPTPNMADVVDDVCANLIARLNNPNVR